MKRKNIEKNNTFAGERAAIGGYKPQYDEFAGRVYDCLINRTLEEIHVAESEEFVGKLDDICYVTNYGVFAYQIKWTNVNETFKYTDFKQLIPYVVDSWRKLKSKFKTKNVFPCLITNKKCSKNDRLKDKKGKVIGSFESYNNDVLRRLNKNEKISKKWKDLVNELKELSGLLEEEWQKFWQTFTFKTNYQGEDIDITSGVSSQRSKDILKLSRIIVEMASSKDHIVVATKNELIRKLGWGDRFITNFNHNLRIPLKEYEPIESAIKLLNTKIQEKSNGYLFLEGSPGSGKSTILSEWLSSIPNKSIRYHVFDFIDVASQRNNDHSRGDATNFLYDMIIMLEEQFPHPNNTLIYKDHIFLVNRFHDVLKIISKYYEETKLPFLIIVDGLDHIKREYISCVNALMNVLPSPSEVPEGVLFILGSQSFTNINLNKSILQEYRKEENKIIMPSFAKDEVIRLTKKLIKLNNDNINEQKIENIWIKSQGHPLYLRYIISKINEEGNLECLNDIPDYSDKIELYYERLIGDLISSDAKLVHFLGLLSRVIGEIKLDFISEWSIENQTKYDFKKNISHLFRYDAHIRTMKFFHNSFRQYLLFNTSLNPLTEEYDEKKNNEFYKELAYYVEKSNIENKWSLASYLFLGKEYDECLKACSPQILLEHIRNFRPIWHVQNDIYFAISISKSHKDIYLLVRYLLLQSQIDQMKIRNLSSLTLAEQFVEMSRLDLAKIQMRNDKKLLCSQEIALILSRKCDEKGFKEEAIELFELSYPEFLHNSPKKECQNMESNKTKLKLLEEWVRTASHFMNYDEIMRFVSIFIFYLTELNKYKIYDKFDVEEIEKILIEEHIREIVKIDKWDEFNLLLENEEIELNVKFNCTQLAVLKLKGENTQEDRLTSYYKLLQNLFEKFTNDKKTNLQMAYLSWIIQGDINLSSKYFANVSWDCLGSFFFDFQSDFNVLLDHIKFVELEATFGELKPISSYVPEDTSNIEKECMVEYLRKVFYLAQIKGNKNRDEYEFLKLIHPYLTSFDNIKNKGRHWGNYFLEYQRAGFYEYMIEVCSVFGMEMLEKVRLIILNYFKSDECSAKPNVIIRIILAFSKYGLDSNICAEMLRELSSRMLKYLNGEERQVQLYQQGKTMLSLGYDDEAFELFQKMIITNSFIGMSGDNQVTLFAKWISDINKIDKVQNRYFF